MRTLALAFLLVPIVPAQVVSPAHFSRAEAVSWGKFPFYGNSVPARYLQVHDDLVGAARTIGAIELRPDGYSDATANRIQAQIVMSNAPSGIDASNLQGQIDLNHGTNRKIVASAYFNLSDAPFDLERDHLSRSFAHVLALGQPFASDGQTPLVWEIQITARTTPYGNGWMDHAHGLDPWGRSYNRSFGSGCATAANQPTLLHQQSSSLDWQNGLLITGLDVRNAPANAAVVFWIGFRADDWSGLQLPWLLPGTDASPSGPCRLYASMALLISAVADAGGYAAVQVPFLGITPALNGSNVFSQALTPAPGANGYDLVLSNGAAAHLVAPHGVLPVGNVYQDVVNPPVVQPNAGYVVRFQ